MHKSHVFIAALSGAVLALLVAAYPAYRLWERSTPVAVVDVELLLREFLHKLVGPPDAPSNMSLTPLEAEDRAKKAADYTKRLSVVVNELGAECRCIVVTKAAVVSGSAVDLTDLVRSRL